MSEIDTRIREKYIKLSAIVQKWNDKPKKNGEMTICPAIAGTKYQAGGIMFVGRAINGWCPLKQSDNPYVNQLRHCESIGLDWVIGNHDWGRCRECQHGKLVGNSATSHSCMSPFWQMVKYICEKEGLVENWLDKIVWSNLYKASYVEGGNPTGMYRQQVGICNELLQLEIEKYKPRAIYFITETYRENPSASNRTWFCETYQKDEKLNFGSVYKYLRDHKDEIKVTVMMRPEFRNKDNLWKLRQDLEGKTIG